jgi:hypothetical protein
MKVFTLNNNAHFTPQIKMTVTEIGCMVVKPDLDVMNDSTAEAQILTGTWNTVLSKPGGPQRVYWGLESEDSSRLWAFFDFESVGQHEQFAQKYVSTQSCPVTC